MLVRENMAYSLESHALYLRVLNACVDEGLYEEVKSILFEFHQDFRPFSREMKVVFLTRTLFGGAIELEYDADIRVGKDNIPIHTTTIHAFVATDALSRIQGETYRPIQHLVRDERWGQEKE